MKAPIFTLATLWAISATIGFAEIPEDQRNDVKLLMGKPGTVEWRSAQIRLLEIMKKEDAAGETLAQHLVRLCKEEPSILYGARMLLEVRSFKLGDNREVIPNIDGPYLKEFAMLCVPRDEGRSGFNYHAAVVYLKLHPDDRGEIYWRLRLAATRDAKISSLPKGEHLLIRKPEEEQKQIQEFVRNHYPFPRRDYGLRDAWAILIGIGVLHPGMTVEEASVFLGKPTHEKENYARWYRNTPRHVNPNLSAEIKDGKIVSFNITNA